MIDELPSELEDRVATFATCFEHKDNHLNLPKKAQFIEQLTTSPRDVVEFLIKALPFAFEEEQTYTWKVATRLDSTMRFKKEMEIKNG